MLYCPRCHNTHWARMRITTFGQGLLLLTFMGRFRCLKCERVVAAHLLTDVHWPSLRLRRLFRSGRSHHMNAPKCKKCGNETQRSHRRNWERLLPFFRTYRCIACQYRFRSFNL